MRLYASLRACSNFKNVSVVGGGLMGTGIAQTAVQFGHSVNLIDMKEEIIVRSQETIKANLKKVGEKRFPQNTSSAENFQQSCLSRLNFTLDLKHAVSQSDLVIEAIVEDLNAKKSLFQLLDEYSHKSCILTSNTSSISLRQIEPVISRKDRFAGLHFFNPVPIMGLVEIVRAQATSDATLQELRGFVQTLGKVAIDCLDTPGFVVNRLLVPLILEAIRMVERGETSKANVDLGMKRGAGHPMGPLELADLVGLDTLKLICDSFSVQLDNDPLLKAPEMLVNLVASGKLGRKAGEGFFKYNSQGKLVD